MFHHRAVDRAGSWIPQGYRQSICAARAVDGVPGAPLPAGGSVTVVRSEDVFDLAFVAHGEFRITFAGTGTGAFKSEAIHVSVGVGVDVDQLKRSKIHAIGIASPAALKKVRVKNLQS